MAGQTIVQYGAVTITQCWTTRFEQIEERDSSGADTMFQRFNISVVGYVHAKDDIANGAVGVAPRGGTISQTYEGVSQILAAPRLQFKYRVGCNATGGGGETVFDVQEANLDGKIENNRDVDNGPRCTHFVVTGVVANTLWKVEASFSFAITNCARGGSNDSRVLSNRWSVSDAVDRDRYTTRTYTGRLRMSSGRVNPNSFRALVVPVLVAGMRRESMDFRATEDGLHLAYTIVDKEAAYAAPDPATSWEVVHTERSSMTSTMTGAGDITVTLHGHRNVDRKALIALGLKVMNDRLRMNEPLANNPAHYISDLAVTDYFGSEGPLRIVIQASVVHNPKARTEDILAGAVFAQEKIGTPIPVEFVPGYDRNLSLDGKPGQTPQYQGQIQLVTAFVTYLQTACSNTHDIGQNQDTQLVAASPRATVLPNIRATVVPSLRDETPPYIDQSHAEAVYLEYRMESRYPTKMNRVALPIADDPTSRYRTSEDETDVQAVVSLAPATTMRVLRLRASRVGREPEFPEPVESYQDGKSIAHLMRRIVVPATSTRAADGQRVFTADAEYEYALTRTPKNKDSLRVGVAPWDKEGLQKTSQRLIGAYSEDARGGGATKQNGNGGN